MDALFHEWMDAAVCRTVLDDECAAEAEQRAAVLLGHAEEPMIMDAGVDAWPDAWPDGDGGTEDAAPEDAAVEPEVRLSPGLLQGPRMLPDLNLEPNLERPHLGDELPELVMPGSTGEGSTGTDPASEAASPGDAPQESPTGEVPRLVGPFGQESGADPANSP